MNKKKLKKRIEILEDILEPILLDRIKTICKKDKIEFSSNGYFYILEKGGKIKFFYIQKDVFVEILEYLDALL